MASMTPLAPLAMSQTKEDLLRHLNIDAETYALMSKEVDAGYKWLTSDKHHLKLNCKRQPPYDWSDIREKSKDEAVAMIARSGTLYTQSVWNLAVPTSECPNWIAKWFLYHKFRHRDGRNRNYTKGHGSSPPRHHQHNNSSAEQPEDQYPPTGDGYFPTTVSTPGYYTMPGQAPTRPYTWASPDDMGYAATSSSQYAQPSDQYAPGDVALDTAPKPAYDPVRDAYNASAGSNMPNSQ